MKLSRLTILAAISTLALTGCFVSKSNKEEQSASDKESTSQSIPPTTSESDPEQGDYVIKEPTEITIWTTYNDNYQTIINNAIEEFKTIEPNVTVTNRKQQGSYNDLAKMVTDGFAVDNYPDMVAAYPDAVSDFLLNFKGLDMTKYMEDPEIGWKKADFNDIPENYLDLGRNYQMEGTYSLPASKSTEAMYYNQDALLGLNLSSIDASINNGLPLNEAYFNDITWEELFDKLIPALDIYDTQQKAAGKKGLIDKETKTDWAWVGYDSDDNLFITLAQQYGYGYTGLDEVTGNGEILFNNDGMKNLMKKFVGYNSKHYFTTKGVIKENVNYRSTIDCMLFSIGSTGGVKYQFSDSNPHNVGVAPIPHPEGKPLYMISQGPDFAFLNHNDENRAKALWLFFKLFTNTKYNCAWALETGYSPIRYSVMETEDYREAANVEAKDPKTLDRLQALNKVYAASVGDYLFTSPVFKGSSEARVQVGTIFASCVVAGANLDSQIDSIFSTAEQNTLMKM